MVLGSSARCACKGSTRGERGVVSSGCGATGVECEAIGTAAASLCSDAEGRGRNVDEEAPGSARGDR